MADQEESELELEVELDSELELLREVEPEDELEVDVDVAAVVSPPARTAMFAPSPRKAATLNAPASTGTGRPCAVDDEAAAFALGMRGR